MRLRFVLLGLAATARAELSWQRTPDALALQDGARVIWQLSHTPAEGKPYLHPVIAPDGTVLTELRPTDHPWHRGIWWSWKFIDGLNYWEEDRKTGKSEGVTELLATQIVTNDDGSARADFELAYHPPGKPAVLTERRELRFTAPDAHGGFDLAWCSVFTCGSKDVELGRTPLTNEPNGKVWGGYAGLSLRLAPVTKAWTISNSAGRTGVAGTHGQSAEWLRIASPTGHASITVTSDAANIRQPQPWYAAQGGMNFVQPALLFREPLRLAAGETLTLRYTISFRFD